MINIIQIKQGKRLNTDKVIQDLRDFIASMNYVKTLHSQNGLIGIDHKMLKSEYSS